MNWQKTQKFLWFGEAADQKTAAYPTVAVGYGGPKGPRRDLICSAAHPILTGFSSNLIVTLGTIDGLDTATGWLPPDSPCGSVRDVCYPLIRHEARDDFFKGTLCRDLPADAVCKPAKSQFPGDSVTWYSLARKQWVTSTVRQFDNIGRLTCSGVLALSQDSGSPVFTTTGEYVGAVSEYVVEIDGKKVDGCLVVTFENPRMAGIEQLLPDDWNDGDKQPDTFVPQGATVITEIPRKPLNLIPVGDYLFAKASPDDTLWRIKPPEQVWVQVSEIPPIVRPAKSPLDK